MVLVDKKILSGGLAMFIAGIVLTVAIAESPVGQPGMTEEEVIDLMVAEDQKPSLQVIIRDFNWNRISYWC